MTSNSSSVSLTGMSGRPDSGSFATSHWAGSDLGPKHAAVDQMGKAHTAATTTERQNRCGMVTPLSSRWAIVIIADIQGILVAGGAAEKAVGKASHFYYSLVTIWEAPLVNTRSQLDFTNTEIAFESSSTAELLKARALFASFNFPLLIKSGTALIDWALTKRLPITPLVRLAVFDHFCGGITIEDCQRKVAFLGSSGVRSVLDYSVEGLGNEQAFDAAVVETERAIEQAKTTQLMPFCVFKMTGVGRFDLLAKASTDEVLSAAETRELERIERRVHTLCAAAAAAGRRILVDAEETWLQVAIDRIIERMMQEFNRDTPVVYNTVQMYRADRLAYLKACHARAKAGGYKVGVKLVRGAYMEKERQRAAALGLPSPIHPSKAATDAAYDAAIEFCVDHIGDFGVFAGTHNEVSLKKLTALMTKHGLQANDSRIEMSQLLGMSDNLTFNLAHHGYLTSKYVPYGPVAAVLPYLVRRAEENSAVAGQAGRELSLIDRELKRRARKVRSRLTQTSKRP